MKYYELNIYVYSPKQKCLVIQYTKNFIINDKALKYLTDNNFEEEKEQPLKDRICYQHKTEQHRVAELREIELEFEDATTRNSLYVNSNERLKLIRILEN